MTYNDTTVLYCFRSCTCNGVEAGVTTFPPFLNNTLLPIEKTEMLDELLVTRQCALGYSVLPNDKLGSVQDSKVQITTTQTLLEAIFIPEEHMAY